MKTHVLVQMFVLVCISLASAKIKNGFDPGIESARTSLKHLTLLQQNKNVQQRIKKVKAFILYHELTHRLLEQFRLISPAIFNQLDSLKDVRRRDVHIYVQFVAAADLTPGMKGTANLDNMANDPDAYRSVFGPLTVSVKIGISKHSLLVLAHELGHVQYQVRNLAEYLKFFATHYADYHIRSTHMGHLPNDPSGQNALVFERLFRVDYARFIKNSNVTFTNPVLLRDQIARSI